MGKWKEARRRAIRLIFLMKALPSLPFPPSDYSLLPNATAVAPPHSLIQGFPAVTR
jgi:hypothetical protein